MQLTALTLTNWLTHNHLDLALAPMTVIAGPNASGKSSIAEAIAFGMTADLRRVTLKSDRKQLITDGADRGSVGITFEAVTVSRDIASGKILAGARLPVPDEAVTAAVPYLLDTRRFATVGADDRSTLLRALMRADIGPGAILAMLAERKHPAALTAQLLPTGSLEDWTKQAVRGAAEARGAWKVLTGQTYGAVKGEGFVVAPPDTGPGVPRDLLELEAELQACLATMRYCSGELGALDAFVASRAATTARLAKLQADADKLTGAREGLRIADQVLDATDTQAEPLRQRKAEMDAQAELEHLTCPCCNKPLQLVHGFLVQTTTKAGASTSGQRAEAAVKLAEAEAKIKQAKDLRAACFAEWVAADTASDLLAKLAPEAPAPAGEDRAALQAAVQSAQKQVEMKTARLALARDNHAAIAQAAAATASAAAQHAAVVGWTAIGEALAPDGIPGEVLKKVIGPFNALLRDYAAQTGWRQVAIGADMALTADRRPYALLSRSEQWRADTMLACAIATFSAMKFVVLDEFDVLDVPARPLAMRWLHLLTLADQLDTVVLLGTTRGPPQVPEDVGMVWLGDPPAQPQERAA